MQKLYFNELMMSKFLVLLCSTLLFSCSRTDSSGNYCEVGMASYYAPKFHNRKTASGERYNQYARTAAHRKLPLGSRVKVSNLKNSKSVFVKVNDRGPFTRGRIIYLSKKAFMQIADLRKGVVKVKIELLK